jgi:ribosomal-protein-alanine N-acetyltransferase
MRIETPRLVIRSFSAAEVADYARIVADPRVTKYLGDGSPHSFEEAQAYLLDAIDRERATGVARYAVVRKREGDLIGFCGFRAVEGYVDFGWRYAHHAWGQGLGTEAALAVMEYGLQCLHLKTIAAGTFIDNVGSLRIIQKLGLPNVAYGEFFGRRTIRYFQGPVSQ